MLIEVTMTVRRQFNEDDLPWLTTEWFVENHLAKEPVRFVSEVERSTVDWEWRSL